MKPAKNIVGGVRMIYKRSGRCASCKAFFLLEKKSHFMQVIDASLRVLLLHSICFACQTWMLEIPAGG